MKFIFSSKNIGGGWDMLLYRKSSFTIEFIALLNLPCGTFLRLEFLVAD